MRTTSESHYQPAAVHQIPGPRHQETVSDLWVNPIKQACGLRCKWLLLAMSLEPVDQYMPFLSTSLSHTRVTECLWLHRCCRCCPGRWHCSPQADHLSKRRLSHLHRDLAGRPRDSLPFWNHLKCNQQGGLQRGPAVLGGGCEGEDLLGAGAHLPQHPEKRQRGGLVVGPGQRVLVRGVL